MEAKELTRSGVTIKVARFDEHNLVDIRGRRGGKLIFMAAVTPGSWPRLKESIATAEEMIAEAGWLEEEPQRPPCPGHGSLLHLVKSQ
jgi:hypothetical protein